MADESTQEKTETATPHRREEARKKGQVARSAELNSFALLFLGTLFLLFAGPALAADLTRLMQHLFGIMSNPPVTAEDATSTLTLVGVRTLAMLAPFFLAAVAIALVAAGSQVGFRFSPEAMQPKFEKLDLVKGAKRLFSKRSLFELVRDVFKLSVIGTVSYFAVSAEREGFLTLVDADMSAILTFTGWALFRVAIKIILALMVLAIADFAFQRYDFEKSIRMSKHEVKEELKQHEGSPQMKSRVRQVQRELARMRMGQEVPKADVVVTNPTSLACALKYDPDSMGAPVLLAKGARLLADKIKEIAREADVPIVENKPLARALYSSVEIGGTVPAELYKAVAEVLAYVYRLKSDSGATRSTVSGGADA
ncbi:MAG: flagellar biosynthesis protein FlhB [candidate division Zixibacteria bacterium]|nr:flagellar biosynthesis protein FlhB [candidate division Zixibacteria bacterium]